MDDNTNTLTLADAFAGATFRVNGNGPRNIDMLKEAFESVDGTTGSDHYGQGELIEQFQQQMAEELGKPAAVFFPSGTMAQQIALRIWCDRNGVKRVAYHPLSHLELHEQNALKELHHIESILIGDQDRVTGLEDVTSIKEDISCLLLELPQREIGGQLPSFEQLEAIANYCREQGIRLHLDGARLFEITPYYGKTAAQICSLFDTVYISFYKGIGGIAGAILAGEQDVMQEAKVWKHRHGGNLIGLYPYILSSKYYYEQRVGKMDEYYEQAKELAALFNGCAHIHTLPAVPVSNMFHVHIDRPIEVTTYVLRNLAQRYDIGITSYVVDHNGSCSFECTIGDKYALVPQEQLYEAMKWLDQQLAN
ncbi:threonine aldolase family protein [Paenibacillus campi]|uniref:threonine aldolase family protein n=1 Tax=Paenibacillus campi TaxID=3106031 RepID=UPI002AFFBD22|nr:beta-eliminating lyase-related protein [Paenibacillus sp. SGZ-1014]